MCVNICTVCVCVCLSVCKLMSQLAGQGNPYYDTWIEFLKPKQTVANSPAAWPLLQIVNVFNDRTTDYHDHSLHTSSSSSSLVFSTLAITRHSSSSQPAAPCGRKQLQSETSESKGVTLRLKLALVGKTVLPWHKAFPVSLLAIQKALCRSVPGCLV